MKPQTPWNLELDLELVNPLVLNHSVAFVWWQYPRKVQQCTAKLLFALPQPTVAVEVTLLREQKGPNSTVPPAKQTGC